MRRKLMAPALLAAILAGGLPAIAEPPTVSGVTVHVDLSAMRDPGASVHYAHLDEDLTSAISDRLAKDGRIAKTGLHLDIRVKAVAVPPAGSTAQGQATPELTAAVIEMAPGTEAGSANGTGTAPGARKAYTLTVTAKDGLATPDISQAVTVVAPSAQDYYEAMVLHFADSVVQSL
ncbi:MAG: hypothetical protein GC186_11690 [Rhodobacteraceae bacterium]|nr:hypothetical protein [Paracoccaceae bacterium]